MSETTSKLSLFKYNTTADAKQPFSIKDCMNDNWDKLDAFATSVDTIFSSSFSSNLDKKVFSDINKELGKKLEADVLLAENGYIKFNNGLKIQYGYSDTFGVTLNFPVAFTTFVNVAIGARPTDSDGTLGNITHLPRTKDLTGILVLRDGWSNQYYGCKLDYIAIGV